MADIMSFKDSIITAIPIISYICGEILYDEVDDIHPFFNLNKLLAFTDLVLSVYHFT